MTINDALVIMVTLMICLMIFKNMSTSTTAEDRLQGIQENLSDINSSIRELKRAISNLENTLKITGDPIEVSKWKLNDRLEWEKKDAKV